MISCGKLLSRYHYYIWTGVESSYFSTLRPLPKKIFDNISNVSKVYKWKLSMYETPQIGNTFLEKGFCETSLNTECHFIGVIT